MLRVGIIGCGKIADAHASQIRRIEQCEIVAVCDQEELMAKQLAERFGVRQYFTDSQRLLFEARPEVVHITTPPQTHFDLTKLALEQGCHAYVEKPFTLLPHEAEELVRIAGERNLKITVGHDLQYSHVARRARELIRAGYLGGPPTHMESYYCYDMGDAGYARALLADKQHWVRRLPGKLLHNVISHGIARIAEHLTSESPEVRAYGFVSPMLKRMGEQEIIDELRVVLCEAGRTTAYFTFSSQMRPALNKFTIFGPRNGLTVDQSNETLIRLRGGKYKSYAEHFISPLALAAQYVGNMSVNVRTFLAHDFHLKSGMKYLIEAFYRSISEGTPPPIPYREILLTARIMDSIFAQIGVGGEAKRKRPNEVVQANEIVA
jgi:predicted dehydrogenase